MTDVTTAAWRAPAPDYRPSWSTSASPGNAPTALFRLLELLDAGAPKPAAILGIPVGFVGAAESKDALAADSRGVPFLLVRGRIGGSAMTAAAVNALARTGL